MTESNLSMSPVCPHCGHHERNAWDIDFGPGLEGETVVTCGGCDEEYHCERSATIYYRNTVLPTKGEGE